MALVLKNSRKRSETEEVATRIFRSEKQENKAYLLVLRLAIVNKAIGAATNGDHVGTLHLDPGMRQANTIT